VSKGDGEKDGQSPGEGTGMEDNTWANGLTPNPGVAQETGFERETGRGRSTERGGDARGDGERREEREVEVRVEPESISKRDHDATGDADLEERVREQD